MLWPGQSTRELRGRKRSSRAAAAAGAALSAALLAACGGGSDATAPQQQLPGVYTLRTVNGSGLPYTFAGSDGSFTISADAYTFNADGTYAEHGTETVVGSGTSTTRTLSDSGRWTLNGSAITVTSQVDGTVITGSFSGGNTITVTLTGLAAVYQK